MEVWNGTTCNKVQTWSSFENSGAGWGWTYYAFDISTYAVGHDFKIRFKASGVDSYEINYWYLDNVNVYELPGALGQPVVTESWDGTNVNLNWAAIPNAIWYGLYSAEDPYGAYTYQGLIPSTYTGVGFAPVDKQFYKVTAGAGPVPITRGQRFNPSPIISKVNK